MNEINNPSSSKILWTVAAALISNWLISHAPQFDESQRAVIIEFINYLAFSLIAVFRVWFTAKRPKW